MENNSNKIDDKQNSEVTGENISPLNADVTESESTMEVSTHSMDTEKSSYKESDAVTSESHDSNISLQYLTDKVRNKEVLFDLQINDIMICLKYCNKSLNFRTCTNGYMPISM